ncbi:VirB4 family type IV secretion system protein [Thermoanaerobacterium thermosaccharolyticum]|uniref:VirB4 family type IV secretion system protein n=1 Tax=Thermoanaerobacterium thermosaccharolyticum TaxID=1517 RepID=UPI002FDB0E66
MFKKNRKTKHTAKDIGKNVKNLEDNVSDLKSLFIPDMVGEAVNYVNLGAEKYTRTFVVSVYPRETYVGWLDDIFSIGEIDLSVNFEPVDDRFVNKKLTEKLAQVLSEYKSYAEKGDIYYLPVLEEMSKDLNEERYLIQTNKDRMFYISIFVTLHAKNLEELEKKSAQLESVFARKATQIRSMSFRQIYGLKYSLPVNNVIPGEFDRNITTGGITTMFPISNPDLTHSKGIYLGHNLYTGAPVFLDSFIGPPYLNNPHIAVFGVPGSGKSVTMKTMLARNFLLGRKIAVLDPEGEYKKLIVDMLGGKYINIKQGQPSGINLFDIEPDFDENTGKPYLPILEKVAEIRALMCVIAENFMDRKLSALEIVAIEQAVRSIYSDVGIVRDDVDSLYEVGGKRGNQYIIGKVKKTLPTLSDFQNKLMNNPNGRELAQYLASFIKGSTMGMFDCQSTVETDEQIIGFNLFEIQDEFTKLYASFVILSWLWQKFVQKHIEDEKIIFSDETWMFVKYPEGAEFLETLARRGRKHKTSMVTGTQYIEEFLANEQGKAVIRSCSTVFLMRQAPGMVDQTVEFFKLASGVKNLLQTFNPGECILLLNGSTTAVRIIPTQYEWNYVRT